MIKSSKHYLWYDLTRQALKRKYKKDYILLGGLIASTSPHMQVKRNINTSKNIYNDYIKNKDKFFKYAYNYKKYFIKKYKLLPCHYNNILRVLLKDVKQDKKRLKLGGLKVNAFYNNIIYINDNYVTIDIHMMRFFKHNKLYITIKPYKKYTRCIIKYAKKHNVKPKQAQAYLWYLARKKQGLKPVFLHDKI